VTRLMRFGLWERVNWSPAANFNCFRFALTNVNLLSLKITQYPKYIQCRFIFYHAVDNICRCYKTQLSFGV
jgi:hypothetical protein